MTNNIISVYTDGAIHYSNTEKGLKHSIGSSGALILVNEKQYVTGKVFKDYTVLQLELYAVLMSFKAVKSMPEYNENCIINYYIDNRTVVNGCVNYRGRWMANDYRTSMTNEEIKHKELWQELLEITQFDYSTMKLVFNWLRSHQNLDKLYNELDYNTYLNFYYNDYIDHYCKDLIDKK